MTLTSELIKIVQIWLFRVEKYFYSLQVLQYCTVQNKLPLKYLGFLVGCLVVLLWLIY